MKLRDILDEGIHDKGIFKAVFLAGGPGSGKSFMAGNIFGIPDKLNLQTFSSLGLKIISSDKEFVHFLKKNNLPLDLTKIPTDKQDDVFGYKSSSLRSKAKKTTFNKRTGYIKGKLGLIIDGTGRDYTNIKRQKTALEKIGYDTYLVFINTSLKVALERNNKRDRVVPPDIVTKAWNSVQDNIGKFQNLFGASNIQIIDNSKKGVDNNIIKKASNVATKWINSKLKNTIALKWISNEKEKRGITK